MLRPIVFWFAAAVFSVHAKGVEVPSNMTTKVGAYRGDYIDTVDFSESSAAPAEFGKAKLCIAQHVNNGSVTLTDSAGSFVGPATGTYYRNQSSSVAQGSGVFKYVDDAANALVATGTVDGGTSAMGLVRYSIRFDLMLMVESNKTTLRFQNVTRAQQNTGNLANDGFQPVGVWRGSRYQQVYAALEDTATKIKQCLR